MTAYEPIYFILGTYPAAEFQFSIKYKVFNYTNECNPLGYLYFAYTQTSFWDLFSKDPSFYDTSYKPSAFLKSTNVWSRGNFQLGLQSGAEHESNGRGGTMERSQYTVYLQPTATLNLPESFQITLQPRAWFYTGVGHNNLDIDQYRGYADLLGAVTWTNDKYHEKIQFATKFRVGDEGKHAGVQLDLRFNLPVQLSFNPAFQLQYFTGYGQNFIQYNQVSHDFRAGICLFY